MGFWKDQWTQLRGHIKFRFLELVVVGSGASVIAAFVWLLHLWKSLPNWILPTCTLVISLAVFLWANYKKERKEEAPKRGTAPALKPAEVISKLAATKPVDLRGEILELYFHRDGIPGLSMKTFVLMKMRITNHGPDQTAITDWRLKISVGDDPVINADPIQIPAEWWIKKTTGALLGQTSIEEPIQVRLNELPSTKTYQKGLPLEGWIAFERYGVGEIEFSNGRFDVSVKDSFGNIHLFQRLPTVYLRPGELVTTKGDFYTMRLPKQT